MGVLASIRRAFSDILSAWRADRAPYAGDPARQAAEISRERVKVQLMATATGRVTFLPWFDSNTDETVEMRLEYRKMLREPAVKVPLLTKVFSLGSLDLSVEPEDETNPHDRRAADFVRWNLAPMVHDLAEAVVMHGLIDGHSISEKVFAVETGRTIWRNKIRLAKVKPKDPQCDLAIEVDAFNNVVGVVGMGANHGQRFDPGSFVIWRHLPLYGNPSGMSDLRAAYRAYWIKDATVKLRAVFLEKFSLPSLLGKYQDPTQKPSLDEALQNFRHASWMSVPNDCLIEVLNMAVSPKELYTEAIKDLNHEILLSIAGAILQAMEGNVTGARAIGEVHQTTSELLVWYLARVLEDVCNQLARDLCDLNFAQAGYPRCSLGGVNDHDMQASLAIDTALLDRGLELSKNDLYRRYGRARPLDQDDALKGGAAAPMPTQQSPQLPFAESEVSASSVPFPVRRQTENWTCGPAALQSVLAYLGVGPDDERALADLLGASPETGTSPQQMMAALDALGIDHEARHGMTMDDVAAAAMQGMPILATVTMHGGGHWVVLIAPARIMDPSRGLVDIDADELDRTWYDENYSGQSFDHFGIIVRGAADAFCNQGRNKGKPGPCPKDASAGAATESIDEKPKSKQPVRQSRPSRLSDTGGNDAEDAVDGGRKPAPKKVKLKSTRDRAFTGQQVATKIRLSKQETGDLGENIVLSFLHDEGKADARKLNARLNNFPLDAIQNHETIEIKAGQVSNSPGAQQWRLTIGEPGKAEKAWLAQASPEEKRAWNTKKMEMIFARKKKAKAELEKKLGKKIKATTMTVLINPDTKTADIFRFDGWHSRIGWNSDVMRKGYVGSFKYEV